MSAQYRPYRNEDGLENDQVNWGDQELGDVEIYQKTTEDIRVVSNRNLIVGGIGIALLGALLGLLVGYFAHSEHSQCISSLAVALHSVQEENPYIRKKILQLVSSDEIENYLNIFSSESHIAGSTADKKFAYKIRDEWKKHGLDKINIVDYKVLLSYPDEKKPNVIKVIDDQDNEVFALELHQKKKDVFPPFSPYSTATNISGGLVYVNYGRLNDLQHVQKQGISLEGKVLIARQLHLSSDEQTWNAQQVKAAGLILYPDPKEYNPPVLNMTPYPKSWWMPGSAARTDSVLWNGIGDPLTPGYPAKVGVNRLSMHSVILPHIPVQPISYHDAYKLLSSLRGNDAPNEWQGGFNITYKLGPEFKEHSWKVQMEINNIYVNKTIYNVIGYLTGKTEPDRYVLIGSHRDAWAYGAIDGASGTAALLELSRVFGQLLRQGWRPRRTIIFCSWGAEEYSLIGSTEWLEENLKILHGRAIAYINADVLVAGNSSITAAASPLLYNAVFNATKEVPNPNEEERLEGIETVYDAWVHTFPYKRNFTRHLYAEQEYTPLEDYDEFELKNVKQNHTSILENYIKSSVQAIRPQVRQLDMRGSYAPFFFHGGIPAVDIAYIHDVRLSLPYPLYHTEYDDFNLVKSFIDPTFKYHSTITKVLGELLRDLSDSLFLPFNLFDYAEILHDFYTNLHSNAEQVFQKQGIDLMQLKFAIANFTDAVHKFHTAQQNADLSDPMTVRRINDQLLLLERAFLDPNGLPRNIFKRHIILSPSESIPPVDDTFPGLLDEFANLMHNPDDTLSLEIIRTHFSVLVFTINTAALTLRDVA